MFLTCFYIVMSAGAARQVYVSLQRRRRESGRGGGRCGQHAQQYAAVMICFTIRCIRVCVRWLCYRSFIQCVNPVFIFRNCTGMLPGRAYSRVAAGGEQQTESPNTHSGPRTNSAYVCLSVCCLFGHMVDVTRHRSWTRRRCPLKRLRLRCLWRSEHYKRFTKNCQAGASSFCVRICPCLCASLQSFTRCHSRSFVCLSVLLGVRSGVSIVADASVMPDGLQQRFRELSMQIENLFMRMDEVTFFSLFFRCCCSASGLIFGLMRSIA